MITFSEAQLSAWFSPILWPLLRTLAVFTVAPVFSSRSLPMRVKVGLAFVVAVGAQASLARQPAISFFGPLAVQTAVTQVVLGLALGFAVRVVFTTVEFVGELVGLQMGLNFASFFDPLSNGQASATATFYGQMASLLFIAMNGHLLVLLAVLRSFEAFPVDVNLLQTLEQLKLQSLGAELFSSALWMALPLLGVLMLLNFALGMISRVAPQMNIFAIGFPLTLTLGLLSIALTLPALEQPVTKLFEHALELFVAR